MRRLRSSLRWLVLPALALVILLAANFGPGATTANAQYGMGYGWYGTYYWSYPYYYYRGYTTYNMSYGSYYPSYFGARYFSY